MKVLMKPEELRKYQDQLTQRAVEAALKEAIGKSRGGHPMRKAVSDPGEAYDQFHREDAGELEEFNKNFSIAKYIRGKLYERMGISQPWRESGFEKEISKALAEGTGSSGGFLVPEQYMMTMIPLLQAKSVVRAAGATAYTVTRDELSLPKQSGSAGTTWGYENEDMSEDTNPTFAQVTLQLRKLRALLYVSNELIDDADPAVDQLITVDLVKQISLAEDLAFLQGTGGARPLGLFYHPDVGTATLGSGNGATPTLDNFLNAIYAIDLQNGSYTGWVMHPRSLNSIRQIKDAQGNPIYWKDPLGRLPEQLFGLPIFTTTQITVTNTQGTSGAVCSYIILANWPEVAIGQKNELRLEASREGGNAWESDQTSFRAVRRVDMVPRQPNEVYVMKGVKS